MSMPQPIHVALIGRTADIVRRAKKHFRLSAPGIGPAYLATLEPLPQSPIKRLQDIPMGLITLWVALDNDSFTASQQRHKIDRLNPRYSRGFYDIHLPESCVLVDFNKSPSTSKTQLAELGHKVVDAWYATS